jgi:hypothetical protein
MFGMNLDRGCTSFSAQGHRIGEPWQVARERVQIEQCADSVRIPIEQEVTDVASDERVPVGVTAAARSAPFFA